MKNLRIRLTAFTVLLMNLTALADAPNFLLIMTDDQSWVGTSLQMDPDKPESKSDYYQTPALDALLQSGIRFTDGYASGAFCTPSRRCIQVGQSTPRHIYNQAKDENQAAYKTLMSIPRALKSVNPDYQCAHFGKWHLLYDEIPPEVMGYDESDGDTENSGGEYWFIHNQKKDKSEKAFPDIWDDPKAVFSLTRRTGDYIEKQTQAGKPWFVQLSHYAVHLKVSFRQETYDRLEGRPKGDKHGLQEFAAMTEDLDMSVGLLMDRLTRIGALENTYVIFLSDNGGRGGVPVKYRDGRRVSHQTDKGRNHPLAMGKHSIYEGGLRVPFSVSGPGIKPGSVSRVPVSGVDLLPTIADLAGFKGSWGDQIDGGSFKEVVLGGENAVERPVPYLVFQSKGGETLRNSGNTGRSDFKTAIRQGDYKLIKLYGGAADGMTELYDVANDIGEEVNLVKNHPEIAAKLEQQLDDYMNRVGGRTRLDAVPKKKTRMGKIKK